MHYMVTWNNTFKIFIKLKKCNLNWATITHKEIYLNLKQLKSQKPIIKSSNNNTIPWKIITCNQKQYTVNTLSQIKKEKPYIEFLIMHTNGNKLTNQI